MNNNQYNINISDEELEDFENKTDSIAQLIAQLKDGTLDPKDVKIPGELSEEEKQAEEKRKLKLKLEQEKIELEKKEQEKKLWWDRAELVKDKSRTDATKERHQMMQAIVNGHSVAKKQDTHINEKIIITDDDGHVIFPRPKQAHDALDYTIWDKWIPDDPVSLLEMQAKKDDIEDARNRAFEEANPEFCKQFRDDQAKRAEQQESQERKAEKLKIQGNQSFKRKRYDEALKYYHDALLLAPWNINILNNIAQVFISQSMWQDALEFVERALFLSCDNTKSLWRYARVSMEMGHYENAYQVLSYATLIDPGNEELQTLRFKCEKYRDDERATRRVSKVLANKEKIDPIKTFQALMEDPSEEASIPILQNMCQEIVQHGSRYNIAVRGLREAFDSSSASKQNDVAVLLRTSGALEHICKSNVGDPHHMDACALALISATVSLQNAEFVEQYNLLETIMKNPSEHVLHIIKELSLHEGYASKIARDYYTHLKNHFKEDLGMEILKRITSFESARSVLLEQQVGIQDIVSFVSCKLDDTKHRDLAAEILVHLSTESKLVPVINMKPLIQSLICPSDSEIFQGNLLAVLINCCAVNDQTLRDNASKEFIEHISSIMFRAQSKMVRDRSGMLLARLLQRNVSGAVVFLAANKNLEEKLLDGDFINVETQIRLIAGTMSIRMPTNPQAVYAKLIPILESRARLAEQGDKRILKGGDVFTSNLMQCFVILCDTKPQCAKTRDRVIPAVIKLFQLVEDGPTRKNCAIVVAKLAQSSSENMQAVRTLRGMEMLVELGGKYVSK